MSRLKRRKRTDIEFKGCGGLTDAFDDMIKEQWRISDDEYDFICELNDEYLDALIPSGKSTITELKECLRLVDEAIEMMKK